MAWLKGKKRTSEQKEKIGKALKKYFSKPPAKKKLLKSLRKRYSHPSARKRISVMLRKRYSNPSARKKLSAALKERYSNPSARLKMSLALKKYFSNPEARKKASRTRKKYLKQHPEFSKNPNLIRKIDKAVTSWWKGHPNIKKERSIQIKNLFIKNPEKFEKFMRYGSNPNTSPRFKTKQGYLVRSRGEQKIANFLNDNNIQSSYESKTLIFKDEGQICVPDFFLSKYKTYIEFYGGHPKAWKKKVLKNRLYKKYRIPCIFITPAELRNLEYYLKEELR
jgi:hypothetical protein